ncbi:MAG: DUF4355 domain-containing protein [Bacilli bacterium]|nr:DUF4355 domain-containing protein [Bacilli bacterium]
MGDFKIIETQEQLDSIILERIGRVKESVRKEFEGYISPEEFTKKTEALNTEIANLKENLNKSNEKIKGFDAEILERDEKIKSYELNSVKTKVAAELGLDYKLVSRISGDTEEDIRKDAESLKELFKPQYAAPMHSTEGNAGNSENAAYLQMLAGMKGE